MIYECEDELDNPWLMEENCKEHYFPRTFVMENTAYSLKARKEYISVFWQEIENEDHIDLEQWCEETKGFSKKWYLKMKEMDARKHDVKAMLNRRRSFFQILRELFVKHKSAFIGDCLVIDFSPENLEKECKLQGLPRTKILNHNPLFLYVKEKKAYITKYWREIENEDHVDLEQWCEETKGFSKKWYLKMKAKQIKKEQKQT